MENELTTKELLRETGIESRRTLDRWVAADLLRKPRMDIAPDGLGRTAYWPEEAVERCRRIQYLLDNHCRTLRSVRDVLREERYEQTHAPEQVDQETEFNVLVERAVGRISRQLTAGIHEFRNYFQYEGGFSVTVSLLKDGMNPVLILDRSGVQVLPDFVVSHYVSTSREEAFHIVPLGELVRRVLGAENFMQEAPKAYYPETTVLVEERNLPGEFKKVAFQFLGRGKVLIRQIDPCDAGRQNVPIDTGGGA